ncbi:restriction endonuclease subunit S [Streptomyces sp. NPDC048568]|uniref:restriction endonuclease subunit S n=1 Tax=Streptomyces sp. NPDC048568 TaxID=3365571 RepID=UPI00370FEE86
MPRTETRTGGRPATTGVIAGQGALSVGNPSSPTVKGFRWVRLTDVARLESGHTPSRSKPEYWDGDVPWIGIRDATGNHGRVIYKTKQWITGEGLDNSSARLLPTGTVCLSRTASVGYVVAMGVPMATSQDFVNWVCGPEISPAYLRYLLLSEQETVRRFAHGSTHQTVYFPEAKAFHVCLPERSEQEAIAKVLGALDDKIALNERHAETALELAGCLYENASVAHGRWSELALGDTAKWFSGGTPRTSEPSYWGGDIPWISAASLKTPWLYESERSVTELGAQNGTRLVPEGSILFVVRGMSLTTEFRVGFAQREVAFGQDCKALIPHRGIDSATLFLAIRAQSAAILGMVDLAGHGTGRLVTERVANLRVRLPQGDDAAEFAARVGALMARAVAVKNENRTLADLRDTLLPQLLSGRLRVKDAVRTVEEVV